MSNKQVGREHPRPKYMLDQVVHYMMDNRVCSADVVVIRTLSGWLSFHHAKNANWSNKEGVTYITCHGELSEDMVFATKSELLESL